MFHLTLNGQGWHQIKPFAEVWKYLDLGVSVFLLAVIYLLWRHDLSFSREFASVRLTMFLSATVSAFVFARLFRNEGTKNLIVVAVLGILLSGLIAGGFGLLALYRLEELLRSISPNALLDAAGRVVDTMFGILALLSPFGIALGCFSTRKKRQRAAVRKASVSKIFD